ncbi:MAG: hypothetical protein KUG64_10620 [Cycloclasticus sp.]|nr:hypothetical protein [Cycloclasticus sp.]
MNIFPPNTGKNSGKEKGQIGLKTPLKASHNGASEDERIIALVKLLARRAAVEDYQMYEDALASPENIKGGK